MTAPPPRLAREVQLTDDDGELEPKHVGEAVRGLRERVGKTQFELAALLDVPYQNLSRLENGRGDREPMFSTINRYVRALGWELVLVARPRRPERKRAKRKRAAKG
jgi:DNA-binding XRE family transcriptional regulator